MTDLRRYWIDVAARLSTPVLTNLSQRTLRAKMPVETNDGRDRDQCSHLEAIGRLLAGIAPWLALDEPDSRPFAQLAREAIDAATDLNSPDYCNFHHRGQSLVDAAFLAQGLLRAPKVLWEPLDPRVKANVIAAFRSVRITKPGASNWLLFAGMVEAALFVFGAPDWDRMRIDYAIRAHEGWYKGDGFYGDGARFHADYYNAFVIHPMLLDILQAVGEEEDWAQFRVPMLARAVRQAAVQERLISPEGTFPPVGRSLAYRFGALQVLAQMALLEQLPEGVSAAQVREALTAVIRRMTEAPGTFDADGWLRIGFCGHQPALGEPYISTGSLYLCSVGLLPLGLPADHQFWSDPAQPWTAVKAWSGAETLIDHALHD